MTLRLRRCNLEAGGIDWCRCNNVYQTAVVRKHLDRTEDELFQAGTEMLTESPDLTVMGQSSVGTVGYTN